MALLAILSTLAVAQAADPPTAFQIADIHTSTPRRFPNLYGGALVGDRFVMHQATMLDLVSSAYELDPSNVLGGPSWLETDRFDIVAKAPSATPPETVKLMLRSLLADRFNLVVHNGSRPMPAFILSAGTGKPRLKESDGSGESGCNGQPPPQTPDPAAVPYIYVSCRNVTMEAFAEDLHQMAGGYLTNPVIDSTGLKGSWDFDLKWTGRGNLAKAGADAISIFDAVDKELGLKLELQTSPRPVLIVDSVNQQPTPNPPGLEKILPTPPPAQFEVAVIKPSKPDAQFRGKLNVDQVDVQGVNLKFLISFAWDLNPNDNEVIVGAPKWLDSDRFDILAKVSSENQGVVSRNSPPLDLDDLRQMLRALLADRFKMQSHMENRPVTAYNLIAANPKLHKADPTSRTRCNEGPGPDGRDPRLTNPVLNRLVTCQNMNMAQIGEELQRIAAGYIYSPVLDTTGIVGSWDFTLSFSSVDLTRGSGAPPAGGASVASDPNGAISLFDAVNKELGLKLEKQRRPVPVLIIDSISEQPTEN
jgi:uncharacterized protein (TIGR03435 family)